MPGKLIATVSSPASKENFRRDEGQVVSTLSCGLNLWKKPDAFAMSDGCLRTVTTAAVLSVAVGCSTCGRESRTVGRHVLIGASRDCRDPASNSSHSFGITLEGSTLRRRASTFAIRLIATKSLSVPAASMRFTSAVSSGSRSPAQLKVDRVSSEKLVLGSDTRPSSEEASASVLGWTSGAVPKGRSAWMLVIDFFELSCLDSLLIWADGDGCLGRKVAAHR